MIMNPAAYTWQTPGRVERIAARTVNAIFRALIFLVRA
jgi:hypothetical protein